jgi:hypothetical protein
MKDQIKYDHSWCVQIWWWCKWKRFWKHFCFEWSDSLAIKLGSGNLVTSYNEELSNLRDLENIIRALEEYYEETRECNVELFKFADNFITECTIFKGTSPSEPWFELVLRL